MMRAADIMRAGMQLGTVGIDSLMKKVTSRPVVGRKGVTIAAGFGTRTNVRPLLPKLEIPFTTSSS